MSAHILVVEDDPELAEGLLANLEIDGFGAEAAEDGRRGLELALEGSFDLIILDLMLPGIDGFELLRRLRREGVESPVLVLSARDEETDKLMGFRMGADDYVTKPFSVLEVLARVKALLRRAGADGADGAGEVVEFGSVTVRPRDHLVFRDGESVSLTPKAFELLLALLEREGGVARRHELLKEVWGYSGAVQSRTVDAHIAELRRKLETDPSDPQHILTVWKVGYRLKR